MTGAIKRKKSSLGIKIKPFAKPPTLPDNFYDSSTEILRKSLESILLRKKTVNVKSSTFNSGTASPTTSASHPQASENEKTTTNVPSREELFSKVQDLCTHGFGPRLYIELVDILDESAFSCATRLVQNHLPNFSGNNLLGCYSTINCETDEQKVYFKTLNDDNAAFSILQNTWNVFSDFVQFLSCVINIFMSLDRMFVYIPSEQTEIERKILPRSVANISNSDVSGDQSITSVWDLWDVGMYSLWKHFAISNADNMDCSINVPATYSILDVLRKHTVASIIAELDSFQSSSHLDISTDMMIDGNSDFLHKSLVRNCVSVFRSLSRVCLYQSGKSTNQDFLNDLMQQVTVYLQKESQNRMSDAIVNDTPSKTSYDAKSVVHHVDYRLKQLLNMTNYYQLGKESNISSSRRPNRILTTLVEKYLLTPHFTSQLILHPANLFPILDNEDLRDIKILFALSKRVESSPHINPGPVNNNSITSSPGMELLRQAFASFAKERGFSIIRSPMNTGKTVGSLPISSREMNNKIINSLLRYKLHLERLHREAFCNDDFFGRTLKNVLEDVINNGGLEDEQDSFKKSRRYANTTCDGGKRIAELLAKFIDLRFKSSKSLSSSPIKHALALSTTAFEDDLDIFQSVVLDLFRQIQSKDVFEAFYRQDLSKRLLQSKSSSIDTERSFVSKLKAECGAAYVSKMEGMFKDMELSREIMTSYSANTEGRKNDPNYLPTQGSIDMDVQVLTIGYWPLDKVFSDISVPNYLIAKQSEFETYYNSKYQGRRITWQHSFASCVVKATFPKTNGPRDLIVSLFQALVLMCFNVGDDENVDEKRLTITDIMTLTGMSDRVESERILQSLSMGKEGTQVLKRIDGERAGMSDGDSDSATPKKKLKSTRKSVSDSDIFVFNSDFTSNQRRIRITNIQIKEASENRQKIHEAISMDRLHLIDAAIVRIMKARKTLCHRDLMGEVLNHLKFPAAGTDIKKRIESLIEREYLERVEGDSSRYNYLA